MALASGVEPSHPREDPHERVLWLANEERVALVEPSHRQTLDALRQWPVRIRVEIRYVGHLVSSHVPPPGSPRRRDISAGGPMADAHVGLDQLTQPVVGTDTVTGLPTTQDRHGAIGHSLGAHSTEFAHSVHAEFARSFRGFSPTLGGRVSGRREASARPLDHHLLLCV